MTADTRALPVTEIRQANQDAFTCAQQSRHLIDIIDASQKNISLYRPQINEDCQTIIDAIDFYFETAQKAWDCWMHIELSDAQKGLLEQWGNAKSTTLKDDSGTDSPYISYKKQFCEQPDLIPIKDALFKVIAYFDSKGNMSDISGDFKSTKVCSIADVGVRQNVWIKWLTVYKNTRDIHKIESTSVKHMIQYITNPGQCATMASLEHRRKVIECVFKPNNILTDDAANDFNQALRLYFEQKTITPPTQHPHNQMYLYSRLLYTDPTLKALWNPDDLDDVTTEIEATARLRDNAMTTPTIPLNQILYGPAGTGKTYHTINKALEIIDPTFLNDNANDRQKLKKRFDELMGEQIRFVTFHQSYSYEDFVEGIRPNSENGGISYDVQDGIFKTLCAAARSKTTLLSDKKIDLNGRNIWKISLGLAGVEEHIYDYCILNHCILIGWGGNIDFSHTKNYDDIEIHIKKNFLENLDEKLETRARVVNRFKHEIKQGDIIIVSKGNHKFRAIGEVTGDYEFVKDNQETDYRHMRRVNWLATFSPSKPIEDLCNKVLSQQTLYNLQAAIDRTKLSALLNTSTVALEYSHKPYVLIIDEINRGNISKIFGELITLIEESKRDGAYEALSVTLPYSGEAFCVPNNVYIIGTMNSSDRSLTGIDLALRRRFDFVEMLPEPSKLKGVMVDDVDIETLLTTLNQRIEILLDADHCIGHAYFMPLKDDPSLTKLSSIFKQKIIPLLQEYFYDDWSRIHAVLGKNNMVASKYSPSEVEALLGSHTNQEKCWKINHGAFDDSEQYIQIYRSLSDVE